MNQSAKALCLGLTLCLSLPLAAQNRGITMTQKTPAVDPQAQQGVYRALIIGNNRYNDKKWPSLKTAVSDARTIKTLLEEHYGFTDVKMLENAGRRDILLALQELSQRVLPNDNVLLYYAGHGFMDLETNKGYWIPSDAMGLDHTTFLRNSTIRDEMTTIASRAKHSLLISDSCFSGTLLRAGTRGLPPENNAELFYQKVAQKKSVQIMAAGGAEYVDDDYKQSGHSPFTYFLLSELKNNDKPMLTVSELSANVQKAVANNVDQVPESGVLQGAGDELGEFIFIKLKLQVDGVPADKVKVQVEVEQGKADNATAAATNASADSKASAKANQPKKVLNPRFVTPLPTL
ncbi:MAG: caspase family protein [Gammaproteobacteria bacterium]|nr:caspase family protein [Gammaproteobacteria bacterium]MDH5799888.1 caspase family protein [Gammaproteobacteria bacterium]